MKSLSLQNKIVITIILFVLFYALIAIYSDIEKIKENYKQIKLIYVIPMLSILVFSMFLRSLLQRLLLNTIGIRLSIKQNLLLFLAGLSMLITPGGSGQMIKSHFIQRKYGHQISKSLPLVFAERYCDFLAIVVIVSMTIFLFYSPESLLVIIVCLIPLIGVFIVAKNKKLLNVLNTIREKIPFFKSVPLQTSEFNDSVVKLFETRIVVRASLIAMIAFFLEGFVIYLGFLAFDIDLGYFQTIQIFYTSVLVGTLSFIPGGVGILEGSFVKLLVQKNLELALITSLIIFIRLTTMWFATALGFLVSYFTISRKNSVPN